MESETNRLFSEHPPLFHMAEDAYHPLLQASFMHPCAPIFRTVSGIQ